MATFAPQPMGDHFVYYNPENTSKNSKHHGTFTPYPLGVNDTVAIYNPSMGYMRPTSSGSQTSYAPAGYMMQPMMTPLASPQPLYHKQMLPFVEQHDTYLHPIDTDLHIVPSTPPLSVSGSNINSPPSYTDSLCTPVNEAFYGALKQGCEQDVFLEPISHEFVGGASPPMTPVFISSASQGSLMAPASCPSLSPSPSPTPRAADSSETEANFCDPRNLTVTPSNVALSDITLPSISAEDEDSKLSSFNHSLVDVSTSPDFSLTFPPLADLDCEEDFSSLAHISTSDNINFLGAKRQRTDLCSPLSQDDDLLFVDSPISEFEPLDFVCHGLPTPCDTDSSFCVTAPEKPKKKMKFVKKANRLSEGDSDSDFIMQNTASTGSQQKTQSGERSNDQQGQEDAHNHGHSSGSEDQSNPTPAPVSRRGRKQSLTEDPSKTFVCDLCSRRFRRQEHLKRHYRSLHTHDKPFACTDCGKKFSRSDNLSQHQRTHGTGAMVLGVLENPAHYSGDEAYNSNDTDGLGEILYNAAAAVSTDSSISGYSDSEMSPSGDKKMKKRKREE